jgi:hypothetical protein
MNEENLFVQSLNLELCAISKTPTLFLVFVAGWLVYVRPTHGHSASFPSLSSICHGMQEVSQRLITRFQFGISRDCQEETHSRGTWDTFPNREKMHVLRRRRRQGIFQQIGA